MKVTDRSGSNIQLISRPTFPSSRKVLRKAAPQRACGAGGHAAHRSAIPSGIGRGGVDAHHREVSLSFVTVTSLRNLRSPLIQNPIKSVPRQRERQGKIRQEVAAFAGHAGGNDRLGITVTVVVLRN